MCPTEVFFPNSWHSTLTSRRLPRKWLVELLSSSNVDKYAYVLTFFFHTTFGLHLLFRPRLLSLSHCRPVDFCKNFRFLVRKMSKNIFPFLSYFFFQSFLFFSLSSGYAGRDEFGGRKRRKDFSLPSSSSAWFSTAKKG